MTNTNFVEWLTARQFTVLRNDVSFRDGAFEVLIDANYPLAKHDVKERLREEIFRESHFQGLSPRDLTEHELDDGGRFAILLRDTGRMMASWPNSLHWGLRAAGEPPSPIVLERVADEMRKDRR